MFTNTLTISCEMNRQIIENCFKVSHSSKFLYQGFTEKYLLGIFLHSKALKPKGKLGVSVHLSEQWCYEVYLFALTSDFCIICFLLIYIILYFIITINVVLFYAK